MTVALSFDLDWAPDFMIDFTAAMLLERRVRATWFVTHRSPAVERLREHPEWFELGIHPNFREGSTHGRTPEDVMKHVIGLVPDAVSMRTHSLMQSTPLLLLAARSGIRVDASLLLPRVANLRPFLQPFDGLPLRRVPCDWEDDVEMEFADARWNAADALAQPGLRTFTFHPVHVFLNSADMNAYRRFRSAATQSPLSDTKAAASAAALLNAGTGTQTFLRELVARVQPEETVLMRDFA